MVATPAIAASLPPHHSDRDSTGKTVNSNFSVWRMTVSLAFTPICSPTKILCRWCTLPIG